MDAKMRALRDRLIERAEDAFGKATRAAKTEDKIGYQASAHTLAVLANEISRAFDEDAELDDATPRP